MIPFKNKIYWLVSYIDFLDKTHKHCIYTHFVKFSLFSLRDVFTVSDEKKNIKATPLNEKESLEVIVCHNECLKHICADNH